MLGEKEALLIERERVIAEKETQLAERDRVIAVRDAELYAKTLQIEHLKAQLAVLRRARFGRSSEKLDREIEQLELVLGELEESVAESNARTEQARQERASPTRTKPADRKPGGRKPLPAHLPRKQVIHQPAPVCACCGGKVLRKIADELTEVLEYVPSSFKVMQHVRPKLSCRACETIVQAPLPSFPIERGRPGPGLLAHVAVSKFADGLPLHRQSEIYARQGVDLDRSTMADWMGSVAALLRPLVEAVRQHVCAGPVLHADDTTVPVLAPGLGRTRTGRLWAAVRDERTWAGAAPPAAFYCYSPDRKGEHAEALLGQCRGFLHADGYGGFQSLYMPDLRIPANADSDSDRLRTAIPIDRGQRSGDRGQLLPSTALRAHSALSVSSFPRLPEFSGGLRRVSPSRARRCAVWTRRSRTASAIVGSMITSCQ